MSNYPTPNFKNPAVQKGFVQNTENSKELLHKELDVNQAEQDLLTKRILMMQECVNNLPSSDPQYNMMLTLIQTDQIEIDQLKIRASEIRNKLK